MKQPYQLDPEKKRMREEARAAKHAETIAAAMKMMAEKYEAARGPEGHTPKYGVDFLKPAEMAKIKKDLTPVYGRDYMTQQELNRFLDMATPKKGKDYFDGKPGAAGAPGKAGKSLTWNDLTKEQKNSLVGATGPTGPMPKHEWYGTSIRFEMAPGKWGQWTDLIGNPGETKVVQGGFQPNTGGASRFSELADVIPYDQSKAGLYVKVNARGDGLEFGAGGGGGGSIGGTITGGTAGSVLYLGPLNVLAEDNANFFYNTSTSRLSLGSTDTTRGRLSILQAANSSSDGMSIASTAFGGSMRLWVDGSNQSRIDAGSTGAGNIALNSGGGNVMVGTTTPASFITFDATSNQVADAYLISIIEATGRDSGIVLGRSARNGFGLKMVTGTNDYLGFQVSGSTLPAFSDVAKMVLVDNGRLGLGIVTPANWFHMDAGNATASRIQWTAGTTTGQTSSDGTTMGITAAGVFEIRQQEAQAINVYINGTLRTTWASGGTGDLVHNGTFVLTRNAIAATNTAGVRVENQTLATVGAQIQQPPAISQTGHVWDTGASATRIQDWRLQPKYTAGNPGTAVWSWQYQYNAGGYTTLMNLSSAGHLSIGQGGDTAASVARLQVMRNGSGLPQFAFGHDVSTAYATFNMDSSGGTTVDITGAFASTPYWIFQDKITGNADIAVPRATSAFLIGTNNSISETVSGAAYINANGVRAHASLASTLTKMVNTDAAHFMRQVYSYGISFHTQVGNGDAIGTTYADSINERVKIGTDGVTTFTNYTLGLGIGVSVSAMQSAPVTNHINTWIMYSADGSGGGSVYPYAENGNLVLQPRTSVGRDVVIMAGSTTPTPFAVFTRNSRFGVATTAPDKVVEINLGTADALRLSYNDSNGSAATRADFTLSSVGVMTVTPAGSAPGVAFAEKVLFSKTAYFVEFDNGNSGTADTIDWTQGNKQKSTLTGNCTFTFTAPPGPCTLVLKLIQDGTGSRTATWPAAVHWPGGVAPTLTTTAGRVDIITLYWDGTTYFGNYSLNYVA